MKIPSSYLRETLGSLLDGITYDDGRGFNDVVPVVASEGAKSRYQIFIGSYSDASGRNSHINEARARQVIEVYEMNAAERRFADTDAIAELVTHTISPFIIGSALDGSNFKIIINRPSVSQLAESSGDGTFINRTILSYDLNITHN